MNKYITILALGLLMGCSGINLTNAPSNAVGDTLSGQVIVTSNSVQSGLSGLSVVLLTEDGSLLQETKTTAGIFAMKRVGEGRYIVRAIVSVDGVKYASIDRVFDTDTDSYTAEFMETPIEIKVPKKGT